MGADPIPAACVVAVWCEMAELPTAAGREVLPLPSVRPQTARSSHVRPPYIRCVLNRGTDRAAVPEGFGGQLSRQEWQTFWRKALDLTPGYGTELLFRILRYVFKIVCALVISLAIIDADDVFIPAICGVIAISFAQGFRSVTGYIRKRELETLRSLCKIEQERLFQSLGFALDCEFEWCDSNSDLYGFCIYFHPIPLNDDEAVPETPFVTDHFDGIVEYRNGYKRIQLFNEGGSCVRKWNPIAFTYYDGASDPEDDPSFEANFWPRFWTGMNAVSTKLQFAHRLDLATGWGFVFFLVAAPTLLISYHIDPGGAAILVSVGGWCLFILYARLQYGSSVAEFRHTIGLRSTALHRASSDTIIVARNAYSFHITGCLYEIRYLYVYRLPSLAGHLEVLFADLEAPAVPVMVLPGIV